MKPGHWGEACIKSTFHSSPPLLQGDPISPLPRTQGALLPSFTTAPPGEATLPPGAEGQESCSFKFPLPRVGETARCAAPGRPATLTILALEHTRDSDPTPLAARPPSSGVLVLLGQAPALRTLASPGPAHGSSQLTLPGTRLARDRQHPALERPRPVWLAFLLARNVVLPQEGGAALPSP